MCTNEIVKITSITISNGVFAYKIMLFLTRKASGYSNNWFSCKCDHKISYCSCPQRFIFQIPNHKSTIKYTYEQQSKN